MVKIYGKKLKMSQICKDDKMIAVTPVRILGEPDIPQLKTGILVKVSGITKGRGFEGVVKRHGFSGGPMTHGQKNRLRAPGSIGNTSPQRVLPGRRMPGHMGVERVTIKNLEVVDVKADQKMIFLKGGLPGNNGNQVEIII
jgi:large subunit ribosomal protein L3